MPNPNLRHVDGLDGFVWSIGVVEDRNDPLFLGRCKVRYLCWHTENKDDVPTDQLPWSYPLLTLDSGRSVVGPKEGDWILGFFRDGVLAQEPVMIGVVPGIPEKESNTALGFNDPRTSVLSGHKVPRDVVSFPLQHSDGSGSEYEEISPKSNYPQNEHADPLLLYVDQKESTENRFERNEHIDQTIVQIKKDNVEIGQTDVPTSGHPASGVGSDSTSPGILWTEATTPYAAKYPYNHAYFSESGHLQEFDDTPGAERVHTYHRAGTFSEIHPKGTLVKKNVDDEYHITLKNRMTHIEAADFETVDWGKQTFVNKDQKAGYNYDVTIGENGNFNLTIKKGQWNVFVQNGDANVCINGNASIKITKNLSVEVGENVNWSVMGDWNEVIFGNVNRSVIGSETQHILGSKTHAVAGSVVENIVGYYDLSVNKNQTTLIGGNYKQDVGADKDTKVQGQSKYIAIGKYYLAGDDAIFMKALEKFSVSAKKGLFSFLELRYGLGNLFVSALNIVTKATVSANNIFATLRTVAGLAQEVAGVVVGTCFHDCAHGGGYIPPPPVPTPEPGVPPVTPPTPPIIPAMPGTGLGGPGTGE